MYGWGRGRGAAAVAAFGGGGLAWLFGPLFGLQPLHVELVAVYSVATLFNSAGVPTAALRLSGQFKMLAYAQVAGNVLRILLAFLCMVTHAGLVGFMVAWTASQALGSVLVYWV